jgi:ribosome-associated translation inhibitor RaiA/DNA-directed RNA polymerase specialized sigma24 family protein
MAIKWNIVNHTGEAFEFVSDKVRRKIQKLESILGRFPEDAVHLQVVLGEEARRKTYTVSFNLRIPSNVLCVSKESKSLTKALDEASRSLLLGLEKDKSKRRKKHLRKRRELKGAPYATKFAALPLAKGTKPQTKSDLIAEVLAANYGRLLRFVNRQINEYIVAGTIPDDAIDPRDIVDQVAEEAISNPQLKPGMMDYPTWCSSLAFRQTRIAVRKFLAEASLTIPVDLDLEPDFDARPWEDLEFKEYALNILHDVIEPEEATLENYIEDTRTRPFWVTAAEKDMVATLREYVRGWPTIDREIFEMHYLEGLSAEDIAVAMQCGSRDIVRSLDRIQNTLRRYWLQIADDIEAESDGTVSETGKTSS